jgi:site-specific recombinase XerC
MGRALKTLPTRWNWQWTPGRRGAALKTVAKVAPKGRGKMKELSTEHIARIAHLLDDDRADWLTVRNVTMEVFQWAGVLRSSELVGLEANHAQIEELGAGGGGPTTKRVCLLIAKRDRPGRGRQGGIPGSQ